MTRTILAVLFITCLLSAAPAQAPHPCAADAAKRAAALLKLHFDDGDNLKISIGKDVKTLAPVRALKGKGRFDVLEVWGYIYKAEYRMRLIYARIKGSCVLMGQEILEASDPY